jgi:hypothetical protein
MFEENEPVFNSNFENRRHNDVTRLDAREESSPGKIRQFKMATIDIFPGDDY